MGKSTDLSIDLKVHIIDLVNCKTKKSVKCMAQMCQEENKTH